MSLRCGELSVITWLVGWLVGWLELGIENPGPGETWPIFLKPKPGFKSGFRFVFFGCVLYISTADRATV